MDIIVLNSSLERIAVVDSFTSLICCKRYYDIGALDLQIEATTENIEIFKRGNYIMRTDDDSVYRIEALEIDTATDEEKNFLIVGGYDLKKILGQRVIWELTNFRGTVEAYIRQLINNAVINPSLESRKISNFGFAHNPDPVKFPEAISEQVTYDNLATKITEVCKTYGYGWKVILSNGNFLFDLIRGVDKSVAQSINPPVIFSPDFENFLNSKYTADGSKYGNVALVAGEGEGESRKKFTVGEAEGLNRYELYVDADGISSQTEDPDFNYDEALASKGKEELSKVAITTSFEGEIDFSSYQYKTDYDIGDVVSLKNEYGVGVNARIVEVTETWDKEGYTVEPVFDEFAEIDSELITPYVSVLNLFDGKRATFISTDVRVTFHYTVAFNEEPEDPTIDSPIGNTIDFSDSEGSSEGTYYVKVIAVRNDEVSKVGKAHITLLKTNAPTITPKGILNGYTISWTSEKATTLKYKVGSGEWQEGSSYDHMTAGTITVYAKAWRNGYLPSEVSDRSITLTVLSAPVFSETGVLGGKMLSWQTAGASYYKFTTNGTHVEEDSTIGNSYSVNEAKTIIFKVKAWGYGFLPSPEASYTATVEKLNTPHIEVEWIGSTVNLADYHPDARSSQTSCSLSLEKYIVPPTDVMTVTSYSLNYRGKVYHNKQFDFNTFVYITGVSQGIGYADSNIEYRSGKLVDLHNT